MPTKSIQPNDRQYQLIRVWNSNALTIRSGFLPELECILSQAHSRSSA